MAEKKMTAVEAEALLSEKEIEAIRAKVKAKIVSDQKKLAEDALFSEIMAEERREAGVVTGKEILDELVQVRIDVAEYSGAIRLDGRPYYHGMTYTVPRHVAQSLNEVMQRSYAHQAEVEGKDPLFAYKRQRETMFSMRSGKSVNAPVIPGVAA